MPGLAILYALLCELYKYIASIGLLNSLIYISLYKITSILCLLYISMPHLIDFSPVTEQADYSSLIAVML